MSQIKLVKLKSLATFPYLRRIADLNVVNKKGKGGPFVLHGQKNFSNNFSTTSH
jgi:hypothetical protein